MTLKSLPIKSESVEDMLLKASLAAREKQFDQAELLIGKALVNSPDNIKALDLLGFVRFFQKRYKECEELCRYVLEIKPGHAYALSGLGMALSRQGQLEPGLAMLEEAMNAAPSWPEPYWDSAVILIEAKELERAKNVLNKGIVNAPKSKSRFEKLLSKISIV